MGWAEDKREMVAAVLSTQLPAVQERLERVDPVRTPEEQAEREADREAIRALFIRIDTSLTEARKVREDVQLALDAAAPTNVSQTWNRVKDALQLLRRTDAVLIDVSQDVKAVTKYLKNTR